MDKTVKGTTKKVYDYIVKFTDEYGYPPSVREICSAMNLKSTSTAFYHINKLGDAGLIKKAATKNRAIGISENRGKSTKEIPVVGKVAAGVPILAVENIVDTITVPASLFVGSSLYFLRVKGDSMINAGILEGDLIAVNKQDTANNGDIVVAMVGDEDVTVKRFFREKDHVRLQAENEKYAPIIGRDISVVGKVVGLIRSAI